MKRRYALNTKINALNQLDQADGDLASVSKQLNIPARTIDKWRANESDLRHTYQERQWRHFDRLRFDMHIRMLERCDRIIRQIDSLIVDDAPLNQLNDALSILLAHINKFEDEGVNFETTHQTIKRAEFYFDGQLQDAPPWATASALQSHPLQSRRLRPPLGQDRTRQNDHPAPRLDDEQTLLVADTDIENGEPSMARLENFYRDLV